MDIRTYLENGEGIVGIEFGSTRIKAVLIDESMNPVASGDYTWENRLEDGIWTYPMEQVFEGMQRAFSGLKADVLSKFGVRLKKLKAMGISGMMHGYVCLDEKDNLLVPFRTWRNTVTKEAQDELSALFRFNIPQRWSIAHLRQAILNKEPHVKNIFRVDTLAGYVHYRLTGEYVVGIGEASGMMPIDSSLMDYDRQMAEKFDELNEKSGFTGKILDIFPKVLVAGENAGRLTPEGALLLDPTGELESGILMAPPEGDAGTGMAATNSVRVRTGNVSAGTSVFSMVVLEKALSDYYESIDMVTTPDGMPVAMVHCNNCTSEINAWVGVIKETLERMGMQADMGKLYETLFHAALEGEADCGKVMAFNYTSGEAITGFTEGAPMVYRAQDADFNLPNFMRAELYSALATLKIGNDLLRIKEKVTIDTLYGHGGYFKTPGVGQQFLADALKAPVSVMKTAGEGGPWGMALLAAYAADQRSLSFADFLSQVVFKDSKGQTLLPTKEGMAGFDLFMERYRKGLQAEKEAVSAMK